MNKLSEDFEFHKFGLDVRLVKESDTDYIMRLRTDPHKSMYIHKTEKDVEKHFEWFKKYKIRESEGRDYYFIYFKNGTPVGVNRIYNIFEYYGTPGSWICSPENDMETSMATSFCGREIMFNFIGLSFLVFDVRKGNINVQKMHKMFGAKVIGESEQDYYYIQTKHDYYEKFDKIIKSFRF